MIPFSVRTWTEGVFHQRALAGNLGLAGIPVLSSGTRDDNTISCPETGFEEIGNASHTPRHHISSDRTSSPLWISVGTLSGRPKPNMVQSTRMRTERL
jgi:hypothetical protein